MIELDIRKAVSQMGLDGKKYDRTKFPMPQWKNENPNIYRKMQISNQIRKIKQLIHRITYMGENGNVDQLKEKIEYLQAEHKSLK